MNGPQIVCAGCGAPTSLGAPVCLKCAAGILNADNVCPLCNSALYGEPKIKPADRFGIHYTVNGGYAGKCSAVAVEKDQTDR